MIHFHILVSTFSRSYSLLECFELIEDIWGFCYFYRCLYRILFFLTGFLLVMDKRTVSHHVNRERVQYILMASHPSLCLKFPASSASSVRAK